MPSAARLSKAYAAAGRSGLLVSADWISPAGPRTAQGRIKRGYEQAFDALVSGESVVLRVLAHDWDGITEDDRVRLDDLDWRVARVEPVGDGAQIDVRLVL